jgi:glyoxylase-like metal-dependent hydrolase (beta-lactamase superfamily II)
MVASDRMKLDLGKGLELEIYLTPGHASHHLSLFERASGVLIAGEAAGVCVNGGLRPGAPPPFDVKAALASIDRLIELKPRMICYGHFGCYDDAVARLKRFREQLLFWHETINSLARAGQQPEEILALLRKQDCNLDYLNRLSRDEYYQEHIFLINTIQGLVDPAVSAT